MKVVSVNVGRAAPLATGKRVVQSAIGKAPVVGPVAVRGVNLTRIESRPTRKHLGDYYFSIDVEGHIDDGRVAEALMGLHRICLDVRFLGSYPRFDGQAPNLRPGVSDEDYVEAAEWLRRLKGM